MKIYLANLAKYNEGKLVGKWIDLPCLDLDAQIKEVLGEDEKYAIHDFESDIKISEHDNPFKLNEIAETLEDLNEQDKLKLEYLMSMIGYTLENALDKLDDCDIYQDMSLKDVVEQRLEDNFYGEIPEALENAIDVDYLARELRHNNYVEYKGSIFRCD